MHDQGLRGRVIAHDLELAPADVLEVLKQAGRIQEQTPAPPAVAGELPAALAARFDAIEDGPAPKPARASAPARRKRTSSCRAPSAPSKPRAKQQPASPQKPELLEDAGWLTAAYVDERRTLTDIAGEIGVSTARLREVFAQPLDLTPSRTCVKAPRPVRPKLARCPRQ